MTMNKQFIVTNSTSSNLLLSPQTHFIFLGIDVILITPLLYFHYLMRAMLKRENKKKGQNLIKDQMKAYVWIIPVSFVVIGLYINVLTFFVDPPSIWIGPWFCIIFELFGHVDIVYIGGFSLWAAVIKYWFIVHNKKATHFGEAKAKRILFVIHILIPILFGFLNSLSNGRKDQVFWVDHCWGQDKYSKVDNSGSEKNALGELLCANRNYTFPNYFGEKVAVAVTQILRMTCGSLKLFYLIFLSNMIEFILYYLIFRYLNR